MRENLSALIARVLKQHLRSERREMVAGWESLLSFDFWHRLVRGHRMSRAGARRLILHCLLAVADHPARAARRHPRRTP